MTYFSEREKGERPREFEQIGEGAWGAIQALVSARVEDASFAASYPHSCSDPGGGPVDTDETSLWQAVRGIIPNFQERPWMGGSYDPPPTMDILDLIEFCWQHIGKPVRGFYHKYMHHYHLSFDVQAGRDEFRNAINTIFRRNGLVYELRDDGSIERLAPPVLREEIAEAEFHTGDAELDRMLEAARRKFLNPDISVRREALEVLWDAWERLKTLDGPDKKTQITALLDASAGTSSPKLREALEREATELTWMGNNLQIRHSETDREPVSRTEHIDYLFHRLFALTMVILRHRRQPQENAMV